MTAAIRRPMAVVWIAALVASAVTLHAQSPTRVASGSIAGRVESAESSPVPIRRAVVTLNAVEVDVHLTTVADDAGAFRFDGLPPGRFVVSASKPPFVTSEFGASSPGKPGAPVALAAGDTRRDVVVRLLRGAAITGTVVDPFGEPAPFQYMSVLRRTLTATGRSLVAASARGAAFGTVASYGVTTDDRGVFRFYGLAPGDYVIVVGLRAPTTYRMAHQTTADDIARATAALHAPASGAGGAGGPMALSVRPSGPPPDAVSEVAVFYPGTVAASDAAPIHVEAGEEKAGIDIHMALGRTGSIDAAFENASGPLSGGFAHIVGDELPGAQPISAQVFQLANGPLHRPGLVPGRYRVEARGTTTDANGRPQVVWGSVDTMVTGGDGPLVAVRMEPAPTLSGRVVFDEPVDAGAPPPISVVLEPADPRPGSFVTPVSTNADHDRFAFPGVPAARYRLRAIDRAAGPSANPWHLVGATVGGHDAMDAPFELRAGESLGDAVVTVTRKRAELAGSLVDGSGRSTSAFTVVLFSAAEKDWYWDSARVRGVHLATDGTYAVGDLPPGDYLVAALADVEASDWFDPEFLARIRSSAIKVTLVSGTTVTQNLRIADRR